MSGITNLGLVDDDEKLKSRFLEGDAGERSGGGGGGELGKGDDADGCGEIEPNRERKLGASFDIIELEKLRFLLTASFKLFIFVKNGSNRNVVDEDVG